MLTVYFCVAENVTVNIHPYGGNGCCPKEGEAFGQLMYYLSRVLDVRHSGLTGPGDRYAHNNADKNRTDECIFSLANTRHIDTALEVMGLTRCNPSGSPQVEKESMPGDEMMLGDGDAEAYMSATCELIYLSRKRFDIQSSVRVLCSQLKSPTRYVQRVLTKCLRYLKGTRNVGQLLCIDPNAGPDIELYYSNSAWSAGQDIHKCVSAAVIQVEGCTLHGQCRGQVVLATSAEAEIVAVSDAVTEALQAQYLIQFLGMGFRYVKLKHDSSDAVAFVHRQGLSPIENVAARHLWLQGLVELELVRVQKIPRETNAAGMMVHPPSERELETFFSMVGLARMLQSDAESAIPRRGSSVSSRMVTQCMMAVAALGRAKAEGTSSAIPVEIDSRVAVDIYSPMFSISFGIAQIIALTAIIVSMFWILILLCVRRRAPKVSTSEFSGSSASSSVTWWHSKTSRKINKSRDCSSLKHSDPEFIREAEICKLCQHL